MSGTATGTEHPSLIPAAEREQFDRDGFLVIRGALGPDEVRRCADALDRVYETVTAGGSISGGDSMRQPSAVACCPEAADLLDHPATFPYVQSILGRDIHVHRSRLDVHPPLPARRPFRSEWRQDGGWQNRELEASPRPRLSVKLAYWLSGVSGPAHGSLKVVPGSHLINQVPASPRLDTEWPDPDSAVELTVSPGDAVLFDRRLWHAQSGNYSPRTRKVIFFDYTYLWVPVCDDNASIWGTDWAARLSPLQRQLLGGPAGPGGGRPQSLPDAQPTANPARPCHAA